MADSIGPPLPHRLDVGESETWAVDLAAVDAFIGATRKTLGKSQPEPGPPPRPCSGFKRRWRARRKPSWVLWNWQPVGLNGAGNRFGSSGHGRLHQSAAAELVKESAEYCISMDVHQVLKLGAGFADIGEALGSDR
jgi:hypothetical protein